jgi:cell wall assembly regulator SMI1
MAESGISRRHALYVAGAILTVGCSSQDELSGVAKSAKRKSDMDDVTKSWGRIRSWLSKHAPKIISNLNPPATDREILDAEKRFGIEMPTDWRDLYRGHNGMNSDSNMGSLFYGMQFLTLERAVQEYKNSTAPVENVFPVRAGDAAIRKEDIHNAKWIAFAHDGGKTLLRVDMNPAPTGNSGQVIFTDHADDTAILLNLSLAELMSEFVQQLEDGRYFLSKEALAEGDQFLNCDAEIDVVNWAHSARWKHLAP